MYPGRFQAEKRNVVTKVICSSLPENIEARELRMRVGRCESGESASREEGCRMSEGDNKVGTNR
jgi:hypothetical protein